MVGWGGFLAEYGDMVAGVDSFIGVGYHFNPWSGCYDYPWIVTDPYTTTTSFFIGNNYYVIIDY